MSPRTKLSFAFFAAFALFACSNETSTRDDEDASNDEDVEFEESEVRACSEVYARKWIVTLDRRSCGDVEGRRGKWVATPLEESSDSVCTMTWQGERYSRADMDALRAFVTETDAMTAACGGSKSAIDVGSLTPIPHVDIIGMIGANGCDVCGKLRRDGKIIVVLPPYRTALKQFEVTLSDGTSRAFQINASEGARAVEVQLPPPPAGTTYAASRVTIW